MSIEMNDFTVRVETASGKVMKIDADVLPHAVVINNHTDDHVTRFAPVEHHYQTDLDIVEKPNNDDEIIRAKSSTRSTGDYQLGLKKPLKQKVCRSMHGYHMRDHMRRIDFVCVYATEKAQEKRSATHDVERHFQVEKGEC